jgi:hypothetical protein
LSGQVALELVTDREEVSSVDDQIEFPAGLRTCEAELRMAEDRNPGGREGLASRLNDAAAHQRRPRLLYRFGHNAALNRVTTGVQEAQRVRERSGYRPVQRRCDGGGVRRHIATRQYAVAVVVGAVEKLIGILIEAVATDLCNARRPIRAIGVLTIHEAINVVVLTVCAKPRLVAQAKAAAVGIKTVNELIAVIIGSIAASIDRRADYILGKRSVQHDPVLAARRRAWITIVRQDDGFVDSAITIVVVSVAACVTAGGRPRRAVVLDRSCNADARARS